MQTNSLIYKAEKFGTKENIFVTIRLNDECKNGHQDFAITAEIYEAGKSKIDRNLICCGCCHDEILKYFPEFKIFVDLHLCDYKGNPMYPVANGYYHLREGFNSVNPNDENFKFTFCSYYRIHEADFDILSKAESKIHYAILLRELNIFEFWEAQAKLAISTLEHLTGNTFLIDSVRTQLDMPSQEKINEEILKIKNDYYSPKQKAERLKIEKDNYKQSLKKDFQIEVDKLKKALDIKLALFDIGGKELIENTIWYTHNNTLGFNWRNYGNKYTKEEAEGIIKKVPFKIDYEVR